MFAAVETSSTAARIVSGFVRRFSVALQRLVPPGIQCYYGNGRVLVEAAVTQWSGSHPVFSLLRMAGPKQQQQKWSETVARLPR